MQLKIPKTNSLLKNIILKSIMHRIIYLILKICQISFEGLSY